MAFIQTDVLVGGGSTVALYIRTRWLPPAVQMIIADCFAAAARWIAFNQKINIVLQINPETLHISSCVCVCLFYPSELQNSSYHMHTPIHKLWSQCQSLDKKRMTARSVLICDVSPFMVEDILLVRLEECGHMLCVCCCKGAAGLHRDTKLECIVEITSQ